MVRARSRHALFISVALFGGLVGFAPAQGAPAGGDEIPAILAPASESVMLFALQARGVQIYACDARPDDPATFVWTFQAPEAELRNERGEVVGRHFAGPTWQSHDGSAVVGAVLERADAPEPDAIPWLLLEATEHAGSGAFATTTHIQRLDTAGGVAPAAGCDATHAGEEVREPYEATYAFFYSVAPAA